METLIGTIRTYQGIDHPWARGTRVVIVSRIESDGRERTGEWIEFAPLIKDVHGRERASFVTSDARVVNLGPIEGFYPGDPQTFLAASLQH